MQGCRQGRINALLPSRKHALVSLWQHGCSPLWCVWPALDTHHIPVTPVSAPRCNVVLILKSRGHEVGCFAAVERDASVPALVQNVPSGQ